MTIEMCRLYSGGETFFNLGAEFMFDFSDSDAASDGSFYQVTITPGENAAGCERGKAGKCGHGVFFHQGKMNADSECGVRA